MSILDTFFILFDSDASKLDKGLADSDKKADGLGKKLGDTDKAASKLGSTFLDLAGKAAGLLGVGVSLGALALGVKHTAEENFELQKLATQFKTTADAVDEFSDAGELLGLKSETTVGGLKALDRAINDTSLDMGRAKKVFEEIGIKVEDMHGKVKPTTVVMDELAAKMAGFERGKQLRIMERLGLDPALLKLFTADMVGLRARMAAIDEATGFDLAKAIQRSTEFTKASKAMNLELKTLGMFASKFFESLNVAVMPVFTKALELATKALQVFVNFLLNNGRFVEGVLVAIASAAAYLLAPALLSSALAAWALLAPFLLIGIAVVAAGAAFALLYDDIMNFMDGNESLIGQILTKYPAIADMLSFMGDRFKDLWTIAKLAGGGIVEAFNWVIDVVKTAIGWIGKGMSLIASFGLSPQALVAGTIQGGDAIQNTMMGASNSPLASQSSSSITNGSRNSSSSVSVGKVEVYTQATDAEGISKSVGNTLGAQLQQASSNYDDGVGI